MRLHGVHRNGPAGILLLAATGFVTTAACATESAPAILQPHDRILFVGDSLTVIGGLKDFGYLHPMREAFKATSGIEPTLIPLGGSGQGVMNWVDHVKRSYEQHFIFDIKDIDVKDTLDAGADVVVVMLGVNDNVRPNLTADEPGVASWIKAYGELIPALKQRTKARVIALATVTMVTEDPASPKNQLMDRMNQAVIRLAKETGCPLLPTAEECWRVQKTGRSISPDFHLTYDFIHPGTEGHLAIAMAMLKGLGQPAAAEWLEKEKLGKIWEERRAAAKTVPVAPVKAPAGWLVGTGFIQQWESKNFDPVAARNPVDDAIEQGRDFTKCLDHEGKALTWRVYVPSIDYTGYAAPGSVDFFALTSPRPFEGGYAARWIQSDRERPVKVAMFALGFTVDLHVTVWLNGKQLICGEASFGPANAITAETSLRAGWNTLVFKSCHREWLWQTSVDLLPVGTDDLSSLQYAMSPPGEK